MTSSRERPATSPGILTDVRMVQSQLWTRRTANIYDTSSLADRFLEYVPFSGLHNILRVIVNTLKFMKLSRNYECIVTGNTRVSQLLGFLKKTFKLIDPDIVAVEIMLDDDRSAIIKRIKQKLQAIALSGLDAIVVSSRGEIEIYSRKYGLPPERFFFVPYHTNIVDPAMEVGNGNYILSAGKTLRDFRVFVEAMAGLDTDGVIVGDESSVRSVSLPKNVRALHDVPYPDYVSLLKNALCVVVPLKTVDKSTGQVVILEAKAMGKVVVATKTVGTVDYIRHGIDGFMMETNDPTALRELLKSIIRDRDLRRQIGQNALEDIKNNHTFTIYAMNILGLTNKKRSIG